MKNILNKKLNKKGFTLAELLIVVAIIAILVAIALPLFFGALDGAKEATFNANKRSVKAAGVAYLLNNTELIKEDTKTVYVITGKLDGTGDIKSVKVEAKGEKEDKAEETEYENFAADTGDKDTGYKTIVVYATNTDVTTGS